MKVQNCRAGAEAKEAEKVVPVEEAGKVASGAT